MGLLALTLHVVLVNQAGNTMDTVRQSVRHVAELIDEISAASQAQTSGMQSVNQAVSDIDRSTQQNAAMVEELAAAAQALADPAALPVLLQHDQAIATLRGQVAQRDALLAQAAGAYKTRLQLLNALSAATTSWAQAHRDLAVAVQQKRKVSVAELQGPITELKSLAKKVSDL